MFLNLTAWNKWRVCKKRCTFATGAIWGHIVDELVEFKKKADECREMARATPNSGSRQQLLKAAEAWDNLAVLRKQRITHH